MSIKTILNQLAADSSILAKEAILKQNADNKTLQHVCYLAESPRIKFYMKQLPQVTTHTGTMELTPALHGLSKLYKREVAGGAASQLVESYLTQLSADDADVLRMVILKDLKCNVGTSLMNKTWAKLIETTPYMGASPFEEKLARNIIAGGKGISQIKMDGQYANTIIRGGDVEMLSRSGETYYFGQAAILADFSRFPDCVLNGELMLKGFNRFKSNGIISSLINIGKKTLAGEDTSKHTKKLKKEHGLDYAEAIDLLQLVAWDTITPDEYFDKISHTPYQTRFDNLVIMLDDMKSNYIKLIESIPVHTYGQAIDHFQGALNRGDEGTILKDGNGKWVDDKPKWQVKMKLEITVEMKVVSLIPGTKGTKNENVYSSINLVSEDGLVLCKASGMKEATMQYLKDYEEQMIGKIIEVESCGLTPVNDEGKYALLHPRFKAIRHDKKQADTLEQIQKIEAMAKELTAATA